MHLAGAYMASWHRLCSWIPMESFTYSFMCSFIQDVFQHIKAGQVWKNDLTMSGELRPGMGSGRDFLSCKCGSGGLGGSRSGQVAPPGGTMALSEANICIMCLSVPSLLWPQKRCLSVLNSRNRKINSDPTFIALNRVIAHKIYKFSPISKKIHCFPTQLCEPQSDVLIMKLGFQVRENRLQIPYSTCCVNLTK